LVRSSVLLHFIKDRALKGWYPRDIRTTREQIPKHEVLPDMPYRPFMRHTVSINRKPSINNASALRDYTERVRQVLNEMQQNGASNQPVPDGGRSRLFPTQPVSDSYS